MSMKWHVILNGRARIKSARPHHKPRNVTLTKIARLARGNMTHIKYVSDTAADIAIKGQHLGFDVAGAALNRLRGVPWQT